MSRTISTGSLVVWTAFQSPLPFRMNMKMSTYMPIFRSERMFWYASTPCSMTCASAGGTVSMRATSIRISMSPASPAVSSSSCVRTAPATAAVSATFAVQAVSSTLFTVTVTAPFSTANAAVSGDVRVFWSVFCVSEGVSPSVSVPSLELS